MCTKQTMKSLLNRLHARLGDLWWYSLMIFVACRSGDVIQAFIGLWLVPKYVGPEELGAVLPLQQLSGLFAVPLAIIAIVFAKYVNTYATHGDLGKVKSFIHDVLLVSFIVFGGCIVFAYFVIPHFYKRLNVTSGMLTVLILAAGFVTNISNLFNSALQGLKKFKTMTVANLISAPIRLITLIVAMPFRALSGYILGQTTPPATCSVLALLSLRRDLKDIVPDRQWRADLSSMVKYLMPVAIYTILSTTYGAISSTVFRQRLPEIESSAYYVLSRFAEIASYIGATMSVVLFPLAAESHERGHNPYKILRQTLWGIAITTTLLALLFIIGSKHLFLLSETWEPYRPYAELLPILTCSAGFGIMAGTIISYEMACQRFKGIFAVTAFNFLWIVILVSLTGANFYRGILPGQVVDWMISLHFARLSVLIWATTISAALQVVLLMSFVKSNKSP